MGGPSSSPGGRAVVVSGVDPVVVPVDGIFGPSTAAGIRLFQATRGMPQTGIVDSTTWARLAVPVGPGATGDAVVAVQRLLREKRSASIAIDGVYGPSTAAFVRSFQSHMGLGRSGSVDDATWRALIWHLELPHFSAAAVCDYSAGNGPANWGTAEIISTLEGAGGSMVAAGYGRVAIGDVSLEHGGDIVDHETHEIGLDADVRPMRKANDQCSFGSNWTLSSYDRAATRALIRAMRAATPGHVKLIYFNDPVLVQEGLTVRFAGHDDHLHLRICETAYVDPVYRC
jgi:peptidoglycan hydrolase-like protein with peptidoglycan-binding domain